MAIDMTRFVNNEEVSDHTALLPTRNKAKVDYDNLNLSPNAKKILDLVYQNLEEATSEPYEYEETVVTISYGGEEFTVTGRRNLNLGWKKNRPDETQEKLLPDFKVGQKIPIDSVFVEKRQTEPPDRFTDGKLLQAMEVAGKDPAENDNTYLGIGTAATRAEVIEKLVKDKYVKRVGEGHQPQYFVPTDLAYLLYSVLPESLKYAEWTAKLEKELSEIEKGTLEPYAFLEQIKEYIIEMLAPVQQKKSLYEEGKCYEDRQPGTDNRYDENKVISVKWYKPSNIYERK